MSLRATLWALDDAPVEDAVAALILLALADEANDDGTDACPYKEKLIKRGRKSERTIQNHLRELYRARLINFGDQAVAMRRYGKQPGHAPRAWNLNMDATWENRPKPRSEEEMNLYTHFMAKGKIDVDKEGGVQILHPTADQGKPGYRSQGGVQPAAPFPKGLRTKSSKPRGFGADASNETTGFLPGPKRENPEEISFKFEDQEEAFRLVDPEGGMDFFPDLTSAEQELFAECMLIAEDQGWRPRILRKVLGTPLIRKIAEQSPELVRAAFVLAAWDPETSSPRRLLHMDRCPHWERAAVRLNSGVPGQRVATTTKDSVPAGPVTGPSEEYLAARAAAKAARETATKASV